MTPALFSALAIRSRPWRSWCLACSALVFLVFIAAGFVAPSLPKPLSVVLGPALVLPWAVLCAGVWFHPGEGSLMPQARLVGSLPDWLQDVLRWYATLFLDACVFLGAVAWPLHAVLSA